ncbi:MAG: hypothetical protein NW217_07445 [Hyphomicrobiaceae bacterium]|nr:hypothetical protein [Hyphomicrobiaceae bacterium]
MGTFRGARVRSAIISGAALFVLLAGPGGSATAGEPASTADINDMQAQVKRQLAACWKAPRNAEPVMLRWRLDRSGSLVGSPAVVAGAAAGSESGRAAVAAVRCASPFSLPVRLYESWQEILWPFKP